VIQTEHKLYETDRKPGLLVEAACWGFKRSSIRMMSAPPGRRAFAVRQELPISPSATIPRRIISTTGHARERQPRGRLGRVTVLFVAAGFGCGTGTSSACAAAASRGNRRGADHAAEIAHHIEQANPS
jgi:hypothetical protein